MSDTTPADDLLDRASYWLEHYEPRVPGDDIDADLIAALADEVRSLRAERDRLGGELNEAGRARSHAELRASQAETERDALRERCAMDDEGHRRVCGPAIEERDALRAAARDIWKALIAVQPALSQPYPDDPRWTPWTRWIERPLRRLGALVAPDPASPTDTGDPT